MCLYNYIIMYNIENHHVYNFTIKIVVTCCGWMVKALVQCFAIFLELKNLLRPHYMVLLRNPLCCVIALQ